MWLTTKSHFLEIFQTTNRLIILKNFVCHERTEITPKVYVQTYGTWTESSMKHRIYSNRSNFSVDRNTFNFLSKKWVDLKRSQKKTRNAIVMTCNSHCRNLWSNDFEFHVSNVFLHSSIHIFVFSHDLSSTKSVVMTCSSSHDWDTWSYDSSR